MQKTRHAVQKHVQEEKSGEALWNGAHTEHIRTRSKGFSRGREILCGYMKDMDESGIQFRRKGRRHRQTN